MRTLIIGALAATLAGCSNQPLTQRSCSGLNPLACLTAVDIPIEPAPQNSPAEANLSTAGLREETPSRPRADRAPRRVARPKLAAKAAPVVPVPMPSPRTNQQTVGLAPTSDAGRAGAADPSSTTGTIPAKATEQQVASAVADDMSAAPLDASLDTLVAILVTSADVKSVNELAGKTIAIDDRYSEPSIGRVRVAMAAAGATDVRLSKGQTTAISRLAGKEVPAAVIGLVSIGAADSFPELARLKTFRVPLSPRVAKK